MSKLRKIIHIDMDAFFASVAQLDNPNLRGQAVAVGGDKARGVIAAASYEARRYGVRSAMPSSMAKRLCPQLVFVNSDMARYKEVSQQIRSIFHEYTDLVEPLSLDEAFLDVSESKKGKPSATLIANEIRQRIYDETGLTASAGISYCKFLAKVASDINKPNGYYCITPEDAQDFLKELDIKHFFGIGKKTADKMARQGIHYGKDLLRFSLFDLKLQYGKSGAYYYDIVRGIDEREVRANRKHKSIGTERTFEKDLRSISLLEPKLEEVLDALYKRNEKLKAKGRTLTLKLKFEDFSQITRSQTKFGTYNSKEEMLATAIELLEKEAPFKKAIRLVGLSLSNFIDDNYSSEAIQLTIDF